MRLKREVLAAVLTITGLGRCMHRRRSNHLLQETTGRSPEEYARLAEAISPTALRVITDWLRK